MLSDNSRHIMNQLIEDNLQIRLYNWLMRRTTNSALRRVGELPLVISSNIGVVRDENQDRVAVLRMQPGLGHSFVVTALCDGMGGDGGRFRMCIPGHC